MSESEKAIRHVLAEVDGATGMIAKIIAEQTMGLHHHVEDIRNLLAELDAARRDAKRFEWSLDLLLGNDFQEADAKTIRLAKQLMRGLDGRAAIDAAMAQQEGAA